MIHNNHINLFHLNLCLALLCALFLSGCGAQLVNATYNNDIEKVKKLIAEGADVNEPIRGQFRAIHNSTAHGNFEITKLLIENGADVNAATSQGTTPLHQATGNNNLEITKLLIESGANVNVKMGNQEKTPLFNATAVGNFEMVRLIVENGANLDDLTLYKYSAFKLACLKEHVDIATYLFENGADTKIEVSSKEGIELNAIKHHILGDYYYEKGDFGLTQDFYGKAQDFYNRTVSNYRKDATSFTGEQFALFGLQAVMVALQPGAGHGFSAHPSSGNKKAIAKHKANMYTARSEMLNSIMNCFSVYSTEVDLHACVNTATTASESITQAK